MILFPFCPVCLRAFRLAADLTWPLELLYLFRCLTNSDLEVFPTAISDALPLANLQECSHTHSEISCSSLQQWCIIHQSTWYWEPDHGEWPGSHRGWTWRWCSGKGPEWLSRTPPPLKGKKGVDQIVQIQNHSFELEQTCCKDTITWLRILLALLLVSVSQM